MASFEQLRNLTACERSTCTMEEFGRDYCIRGYHVYKEIKEAAAGEALECVREPHNIQDRYAAAVKKKWEQYIIAYFTTKVVNTISCTVTEGEDTPRSVHCIELTFHVLCTKRMLFSHRKL